MSQRSPYYNEFKEWFLKNRDAVDIPPYKELSRRYRTCVSTLEKWVRELGGFTNKTYKRTLLCKVETAHEYLRGCSRPIGIKPLMIASGYEEGSTGGMSSAGAKGFLRALKELYPEDFAKIKKNALDYNSDTNLLKWGRCYFRSHGYPPVIRVVAAKIGRSRYYTRNRVEALLKAYPDAPFVLGDGWKALRQDGSRYKRGRRKRGSEWDQWKAERCPDCLGFEFRGATWERYLRLWDLRRRGYSWTGSGGGGFVEFEKGYAVKLCTKRQCTIDEAMNEAL